MAKDIGKQFEEKIRAALKEIQRKKGIFYHRLKDTTAARNIVGSAPADFLVAMAGQAQLWEAKASEIHGSLTSCLSNMVSDHQVGVHQLWMMNGCTAFFIFYSDLTAQVEVWHSDDVIAARKTGKPIRGHPKAYFHVDDLAIELPHLFHLRRAHDV